MNNIVLNILHNKKNLSFPYIFKKIGDYYWNRKKIFEEYDLGVWQENKIVENRYVKMFKFIKRSKLLWLCIFRNVETYLFKHLITNNDVENVFIDACFHDNLDIVKFLIKKTVRFWYKGLNTTAYSGALKVAKYIIRLGIKITNLTLYFAIKNCSEFNYIKFLFGTFLKTEKNVDFSEFAIIALTREKTDFLKYILETGKVNQQTKNKILCHEASKFNNLPFVKYLITQGAEYTDDLLNTCNTVTLDTIKFLVDTGANFDQKTKDILLFDAATSHADNIDVVEYLLNKGADYTYENYAIFKCCAYYNNIEKIKFFIENLKIPVDIGNNCLISFAKFNDYREELIEYLISKGACKNTPSEIGLFISNKNDFINDFKKKQLISKYESGWLWGF